MREARRWNHFAVTAAIMLVPCGARAQIYRATDLGTLGGASTHGYAINSTNQVVGSSDDAQGHARAFLYADGVIRDLGTLGGSSARALGINSSGQVVGASDTAGDSATHAALWDHGNARDLGNLANDPALNSHAEAISDAGVVVGGADIVCLPAAGGAPCGPLGLAEHAFAYTNGAMQDIDGGISAAGSYAAAIDNTGRVAGFRETATAYVPDEVVEWASTASGLTPLFAAASTAPRVALGPNGSIAASAYSGVYFAGLWVNGNLSNLSAPFGRLSCLKLPCPAGVGAIDTAGNVAGWIAVPSGPKSALLSWPSKATIWRQATMTDVARLIDPIGPVSPYELSYVAAGNGAGTLVAVGIDTATGHEHSFLLSPEVVNLKASPAALDYGKILETTSQSKDIVLQNAAASPVSYLAEVSGAFTLVNGCTTDMPPGSSCKLTVKFAPMLPGPVTGAVKLTTVGGSANGTVLKTLPLTGTGNFVAHLYAKSHTNISSWQPPYTLTWSSAPGVSCTAADGQSGDHWTGKHGPSGSIDIFPSDTGSFPYTIDCSGGGLNSSSTIILSVTDSDVNGVVGGTGAMTIPELLALLVAVVLCSCSKIAALLLRTGDPCPRSCRSMRSPRPMPAAARR